MVEFVANIRGIEKSSANYKRLLATKPAYEAIARNAPTREVTQVSDENDDLAMMLQQEVAQFQKRKASRVIRG